MSYKITIERTTEERKTRGKEWKVVGNDGEGKREYGYTPEIDKVVSVTCEVYSQIVDSLDLKAVIDAVNKPMTAVKDE